MSQVLVKIIKTIEPWTHSVGLGQEFNLGDSNFLLKFNL